MLIFSWRKIFAHLDCAKSRHFRADLFSRTCHKNSVPIIIFIFAYLAQIFGTNYQIDIFISRKLFYISSTIHITFHIRWIVGLFHPDILEYFNSRIFMRISEPLKCLGNVCSLDTVIPDFKTEHTGQCMSICFTFGLNSKVGLKNIQKFVISTSKRRPIPINTFLAQAIRFSGWASSCYLDCPKFETGLKVAKFSTILCSNLKKTSEIWQNDESC